MGFIFVYITNPSEEEAKKLAKHLVENRLAACVSIFPVSSLYWWEGKLADEKEFVTLCKTTEEKFEELEEEVKKIHPYKVPCIVKIPVESNKEYEDWVRKELNRE